MTQPEGSTLHRHTNRLAQETSPYLLQHAHNPVDWYPWSPEAFEAARRENKPIFLSVGYSSCYWCHVMERQSFESEAVAVEMNKRFINIKVDREERPDVDQLYMTAVQLLTRQGGWPMSVFLTPDLRPFYGGTYYPPTDQYGRPGFPTLLTAIDDAWLNRNSEVQTSADRIVTAIRHLAEPPAPDAPLTLDGAFIDELIDRSISDFDRTNGGFGGAPKFPRETLLELLLTWLNYPAAHPTNPDRRPAVKVMVLRTLDALARGGIRDQLGGGFHRYSTDAQWLVPHFEIMLYDNAMLAWCYVEAFRQSGDPRWADVARGILDFVLREMTSAAGAFYTAFDAEVDAMEGASYLWTPSEIESLLGPENSALFQRVYGVSKGPNFADPHHGTGRPDKSILYLPVPLVDVAKDLGLQPAQLEERLAPMRQTLYAARSKRKQPLLDTKVLTSWNALMIRAFAHGGHVLEEPRYLEAATRAADFLLTHHRTEEGGLLRRSGGGLSAPVSSGSQGTRIDAFLDDYAYLAQALLALHTATGVAAWGDHARAVAQQMLARFGGEQGGGFYFTDRHAQDLVVRQKTSGDSPLPSGNAVAIDVLNALDQPDAAREAMAVFARQMQLQGEGMSSMVTAALKHVMRHGPFTVSAAKDTQGSQQAPSPAQLAASVVTTKCVWQGETELAIELEIGAGYHINAHDLAAKDTPLIATTVTASSDPDAVIEYPAGELQTFLFADEPASVYSGAVTILVRFPKGRAGKSRRLSLSYQACSDSACLPIVTRHLEA